MPPAVSRTALSTLSPIALLLAACGTESPPAGDVTAWPKRTVALSTGITQAYVAAGDSSGEPVILLHGYTDTGRSFYPMMQHLLALRPDLRLIALDLRGHGASSMPPPESCRAAPERCFRPVDFAADVLALMDRIGIRQAHVVAHSFGSLVAQEFALAHPDRVRRLVLIGSFARALDHPAWKDFMLSGVIEGPWRDALVRRGLAYPDDVYELTPLAVDSGMEAWMLANWVTEPVADSAFLAAIAPETARTRLGTWIGVARAVLAVDHTERLKDLRVPTLVIWATQDAFFPESPDQELLRAALDSAAARCGAGSVWKRYGKRPLPPSGLPEDEIAHNVQWGAAAAVAADVAAFLREDGAPTRDLYYADPENVHRVLTAEGEATLIERPPRNCPAG